MVQYVRDSDLSVTERDIAESNTHLHAVLGHQKAWMSTAHSRPSGDLPVTGIRSGLSNQGSLRKGGQPNTNLLVSSAGPLVPATGLASPEVTLGDITPSSPLLANGSRFANTHRLATPQDDPSSEAALVSLGFLDKDPDALHGNQRTNTFRKPSPLRPAVISDPTSTPEPQLEPVCCAPGKVDSSTDPGERPALSHGSKRDRSSGSEDEESSSECQGKRQRVGLTEFRLANNPSYNRVMEKYASKLHDHIKKNGGWERLPTNDAHRYKYLAEACSKRDGFYIVLHQCFCLWTDQPGSVHQLLAPVDADEVDRAFELLKPILLNNENLLPYHRTHFCNWPRRLDHPQALNNSSFYSCHLQQAREFVERFGENWALLLNSIKRRAFPVLAMELIHTLGCHSYTMRKALFIASRRMVGVRDQLAAPIHDISAKDQEIELKALSDERTKATLDTHRVDIRRKYALAAAEARRSTSLPPCNTTCNASRPPSAPPSRSPSTFDPESVTVATLSTTSPTQASIIHRSVPVQEETRTISVSPQTTASMFIPLRQPISTSETVTEQDPTPTSMANVGVSKLAEGQKTRLHTQQRAEDVVEQKAEPSATATAETNQLRSQDTLPSSVARPVDGLETHTDAADTAPSPIQQEHQERPRTEPGWPSRSQRMENVEVVKQQLSNLWGQLSWLPHDIGKTRAVHTGRHLDLACLTTLLTISEHTKRNDGSLHALWQPGGILRAAAEKVQASSEDGMLDLNGEVLREAWLKMNPSRALSDDSNPVSDGADLQHQASRGTKETTQSARKQGPQSTLEAQSGASHQPIGATTQPSAGVHADDWTDTRSIQPQRQGTRTETRSSMPQLITNQNQFQQPIAVNYSPRPWGVTQLPPHSNLSQPRRAVPQASPNPDFESVPMHSTHWSQSWVTPLDSGTAHQNINYDNHPAPRLPSGPSDLLRLGSGQGNLPSLSGQSSAYQLLQPPSSGFGMPHHTSPSRQQRPLPMAPRLPTQSTSQQPTSLTHPVFTQTEASMVRRVPAFSRQSTSNNIGRHMAQVGDNRSTQRTILPQPLSGRPESLARGLNLRPLRDSDVPTSPHDWVSAHMAAHMPRSRSPSRRHIHNAVGQFYQYMEGFAMVPQRIDPAYGIRSFPLYLYESALAQFPKLQLDGFGSQVHPFWEGSKRVRLRCCERLAEARIDEESWVTYATTWPSEVYITFNGQHMDVPRKLHFTQDLPIELTDWLIPGRNELSIVVPRTNKPKHGTYFFAVESIRTTSHEMVLGNVTTRVLSTGQTKKEIARRLSAGQDDDIQVDSGAGLRISMRDPWSSSLCDFPVRGVRCRHLECFDLKNLLFTRSRKPTSDGKTNEPTMADHWKCPICDEDVRPKSLGWDQYMQDVRKSLIAQGKGHVGAIVAQADGSWTAVEEPGDEDEEARMASSGQASRAASTKASEVIEIEDD